MTQDTRRSVPRMVARAALGYVAYLLSVPAVLLQALALFCGASAALVLALSYDPGFVEETVVRLLATTGLAHASYSGNPVPAILRAYALLALAFDVVGLALRVVFPNTAIRMRMLFGWMVIADSVCYALFGAAFLSTGQSAWPAVILFAITVPFTALAFAAHRLPRLADIQVSTIESPKR